MNPPYTNEFGDDSIKLKYEIADRIAAAQSASIADKTDE